MPLFASDACLPFTSSNLLRVSIYYLCSPAVPTYIVNLDLPPKERWNNVVKEKGPEVRGTIAILKLKIKSIRKL